MRAGGGGCDREGEEEEVTVTERVGEMEKGTVADRVYTTCDDVECGRGQMRVLVGVE
jgi:hypothetical protein